jgi:predicted Zn-dependent peptidase
MSSLPATEHLTLANGLRVVLCHAPRLKRCAASLRVAAGSHDVPAEYPGLAHFLEHLLFLGTERFADDEKLMNFVQRHGGQVNASTRERSTDFFFELPKAVFADGLARLWDMLAHPRMSLADQLREREVLHAEFIAWWRDAATHQQLQQFAGLSPRHPLRGFHAGNRYSLPILRQNFQHALRDFYQRFYQPGQMTLCLAGPQSLHDLKALATTICRSQLVGEAAAQATQNAPPKLLNHSKTELAITPSNLLFACEDLPEGADEAAAFLCHCLNGSRAAGDGEPIKAQVIYQFAGQLLIKTEARTPALIHDWLSLFKIQWRELQHDYNLLAQRKLEVSGPLELAHYYARNLPQGLSAQGETALLAMLQQLQPGTQAPEQRWQLPEPNPFLSAPGNGHEGAFYLRWRLPAPQPALWRMQVRRLKPLAEQASQAGVTLELSAYGPYWELKLAGIDAPMAQILTQALRQLNEPAASELLGQTNEEPALIPIRQLLNALPDCYLNAEPAGEIADVHAFWTTTQWLSFMSGLSQGTVEALDNALRRTPGTRDLRERQAPTLAAGKHWRFAAPSSSESAVLLFCPAPSTALTDEAAWRLLAHLAQGPFYQRLRVELQLGYAVFSGVRQIAGQTGIVFGVQSPSASVAQLIEHIERFLQELPDLIANTDLACEARALSAQLDVDALQATQVAHLHWQAHLAGRDERHLAALYQSVANLDKPTVLQAAARLHSAAGGWLCLTNDAQTP